QGQGPLEIELLERHIRDIPKRNRVIQVIYDERFFDRSAQALSEEFDMIAYPNSVPKKVAESRRLYEAITEARIEHDGDPVLRAHVNAGVWKETSDGAYLSK